MIRISSQQIFSGGINRLQDINSNLIDTQQQLSTGKKVNKPSDDPVAAARILKRRWCVGLGSQIAPVNSFPIWKSSPTCLSRLFCGASPSLDSAPWRDIAGSTILGSPCS